MGGSIPIIFSMSLAPPRGPLILWRLNQLMGVAWLRSNLPWKFQRPTTNAVILLTVPMGSCRIPETVFKQEFYETFVELNKKRKIRYVKRKKRQMEINAGKLEQSGQTTSTARSIVKWTEHWIEWTQNDWKSTGERGKNFYHSFAKHLCC